MLIEPGAGRSFLARALDRVAGAAADAWTGSLTQRTLRWSSERLALLPPARRSRLVALAVAAASVTALVLRTWSSRPEPLTWMVPASALAAGIVMAVLAGGES